MTGQNHAKYLQSAALPVNGDVKMRSARCAGSPTVPTRPRLATIPAAALYLGLGTPDKPSVRSVWRLIEHGDLTPVKLPGLRRTMVLWSQLDALVDRAIDEGEPA